MLLPQFFFSKNAISIHKKLVVLVLKKILSFLATKLVTSLLAKREQTTEPNKFPKFILKLGFIFPVTNSMRKQLIMKT